MLPSAVAGLGGRPRRVEEPADDAVGNALPQELRNLHEKPDFANTRQLIYYNLLWLRSHKTS